MAKRKGPDPSRFGEIRIEAPYGLTKDASEGVKNALVGVVTPCVVLDEDRNAYYVRQADILGALAENGTQGLAAATWYNHQGYPERTKNAVFLIPRGVAREIKKVITKKELLS